MAMIANSQWTMEPLHVGHDVSQGLVNLVTKRWRCVDANLALCTSFLEFMKLSKIALIYVIGSLEDERAFSSVTFLEDNLRNRLDGEHLSIVVGMHNQSVYTLTSLPYEDCFKQWLKPYKFH